MSITDIRYILCEIKTDSLIDESNTIDRVFDEQNQVSCHPISLT